MKQTSKRFLLNSTLNAMGCQFILKKMIEKFIIWFAEPDKKLRIYISQILDSFNADHLYFDILTKISTPDHEKFCGCLISQIWANIVKIISDETLFKVCHIWRKIKINYTSKSNMPDTHRTLKSQRWEKLFDVT